MSPPPSNLCRRLATPRRWAINTRLVALVVVPLLGLSVVSAALAAGQYETSAQARVMQGEVDHVSRLVAVRAGLHVEKIATEATLQARSFGFTGEQVRDLLGFEPSSRLHQQAARTDQDLGDDIRPLADPAELQELRDGVQAGTISSQDAMARFEAIDQRLLSAMDETFAQLERRTGQVREGDAVFDAFRGVRAAVAYVDMGATQLVNLEKLFLRSPAEPAAHKGLIEATARETVIAHELDQVRDPAIATRWRELQGSDDHRTVSGAIARAIDDAGAFAGDIPAMLVVSRAWLTLSDQLYEFIRTSITALHDAAARLGDQATADQLWWSGLVVAVTGLTVAVSIRVAQSISRPVKRLGSQAAAASSGELDLEPLAADGPRDLTSTMNAFDDLVANLRLLEAKTQALAACDFDAPVLAQSLPGHLGESLHRSVGVLAGSMVERDELQHHLVEQATHDALTGLCNRTAAATALRQALARSHRSEAALAVLFIDLDDFKRANDTYGHAVGDQVLRTVASRLEGLVRDTDFLARLGGDEFLVLVEDVIRADEAISLAHRVVAVLDEPIDLDGTAIGVGACVGIAFAGGDEREPAGQVDPDQLLAWADLAVYRAKRRGRGQVEVYDASLQQELLARAEIHEALERAIAEDQLFLQYQPVVDATGRLHGVEALVRWDRPGHGIVPPDDFIPVAESSNLIIELDRWVLEAATRQLVAWNDVPGLVRLSLAVNVSGRHLLSGRLPANVAAVLDRSGVDPSRLVIEITETVLLTELATAATELNELREVGVRVAIDDFGTGYTSVMHLRTLPADVLKIDRSFVSQDGDDRSRDLLAMMIDLGHHLGLSITAEGVETPAQLAVLRELHCDHAQGFLLSRPLAPERLVADFGESGAVPEARWSAAEPPAASGVPTVAHR